MLGHCVHCYSGYCLCSSCQKQKECGTCEGCDEQHPECLRYKELEGSKECSVCQRKVYEYKPYPLTAVEQEQYKKMGNAAPERVVCLLCYQSIDLDDYEETIKEVVK